MRCSKRHCAICGAVFLAGIGFAGVGVRRFVNWRATSAEKDGEWPMDDAIPNPTVVTTRAITIDAPAAAVWPWLAQMGEVPRGGFYSHISVERMCGMTVKNADRIMPEFQELSVGLAFDRRGTMLVQGFETGRWLVLGPPEADAFASTWLLDVVPIGADRCRLVSRVRVQYKRKTVGNAVIRLVLAPGQLIMERKMFAELKRRAERFRDEPELPPRSAGTGEPKAGLANTA